MLFGQHFLVQINLMMKLLVSLDLTIKTMLSFTVSTFS